MNCKRVVLSIGWQRHTPVHGCVFSQCAVSVPESMLDEHLNPDMPGRRRGELRYEGAERNALRMGHWSVYTDLLDVGRQGHPLLHDPRHPLHERAARTWNSQPLEV